MILTLILILAFVFRLVALGQSFWLDEGTSYQFASLNLTELFSVIKSDFHPPLYYLLVKLWLPFAGHSEWLIRLPGVIFGVAQVYALYLLVKLVTNNRQTSLIAALLLAINPLHIYYSQELRMYSMAVLFTILSWYFLLNKKPIFYFLSTILGLYTFYGLFFVLLSQWVYVLIKKENIKSFLVVNLNLGIAFLPWVPTLLQQLSGGGYLTQVLPNWSTLSGVFSLKALALIPTKFIMGRISVSPTNFYMIISGLLIAYSGLLILIGIKKDTLHLSLWLIIPIIVSAIISINTPILGYWRLLTILPAFIALLAIGINHLPNWATYSNLAVLVSISIMANIIFWITPSFQREDWRGLSNKILSDKNSQIIINFPSKFAPMHYYMPDTITYFSQQSLGKMRTDIDNSVGAKIKPKSTVYLLDYLSDLTDPQRTTLKWLKQIGLKEINTHTFTNLGTVYEFKAP